MPERKQRCNAVLFVTAITDENTFFVNDSLGTSRRIVVIISRVFFPALFKRGRQPTRRIHVAEEYLCDRRADRLASCQAMGLTSEYRLMVLE